VGIVGVSDIVGCGGDHMGGGCCSLPYQAMA